MGNIFYQVFEYEDDEKTKKRRIYTFSNANAAHDMIEFILKHDFLQSNIGVEECEASTKL